MKNDDMIELEFESECFPQLECDEAVKDELGKIVIQHACTEEQVAVLYALTKDVEVVTECAERLDRGYTFPDNDLADLAQFIKDAKTWSSLCKDVAEGMKAMSKAGVKGAKAGAAFRMAFMGDKLMRQLLLNTALSITGAFNDNRKSKQDHRPPRVRKKHLPPKTNYKSMQQILSKSHRGGHVYKRRG